MPRAWRTPLVASLLFAAVSCGGSPTASSTVSTNLHGEVTDPIGDTLSDPRVLIPPDLARATVDVVGGNVTFVVQFASGTFNHQTTRVSVLLDTDQNASTGIRQQDGMGTDYGIDLDAGTGQAAVTKADPVGCTAHLSCFNPVGGLVPITFLPDGMQVTVSLSLLGNGDGRMSFQLNSYVLVGPSTAVVFDFMPDSNLPPGRVQ